MVFYPKQPAYVYKIIAQFPNACKYRFLVQWGNHRRESAMEHTAFERREDFLFENARVCPQNNGAYMGRKEGRVLTFAR